MTAGAARHSLDAVVRATPGPGPQAKWAGPADGWGVRWGGFHGISLAATLMPAGQARAGLSVWKPRLPTLMKRRTLLLAACGLPAAAWSQTIELAGVKFALTVQAAKS